VGIVLAVGSDLVVPVAGWDGNMNPQRLRHRVTFQQQISAQDEYTGKRTTTWETVHADVPAEVLTGPGREAITGGAKHTDVSARINTRWFDGLDTSWRVLWDGKQYDIVSAETDVTARREWRLTVKSIGDGT